MSARERVCVRVYKVHVCTHAWGGQKTTLDMFPPQTLPVFELGCLSRTLTLVVKLAGQHVPGSSTSPALRSQAQATMPNVLRGCWELDLGPQAVQQALY